MGSVTQVDAVVIGSGIIGAMAAHYLQEDGRTVAIVERGEVARGTSSGNAGILAFPEIFPIPAPGVIAKLPKWLLDPLGPLSLPPAYALQMVPWLWRFWRASARPIFERGIAVNTKMMALARQEMTGAVAKLGLDAMLSETGTLDLYDDAASFGRAAGDWQIRKAAGVDFVAVGRAEIDQLQPGLAAKFTHGMFTPSGLQVSDPYDFTKAIVDRVIERGASLYTGEVTGLDPSTYGARIRFLDGSVIEARSVVLAGGAWSKALAAGLGDPIPLETERGYNTTLPPGAFALQRQIYFNDHGFVVTPLSTGIRIGGAVELGGLTMAPNYRRSDAMLKKAKMFLPQLNTEGGRQWMGHRPSTPDCLPVIGASKASNAIVYAFGHGHLGLTQSAATGRLVSDIVSGRKPAISVDPFRASRFG